MVPAHHRQERRFFHYQPQERITQKYPGRKHLSPHGCPARYRRWVAPFVLRVHRSSLACSPQAVTPFHRRLQRDRLRAGRNSSAVCSAGEFAPPRQIDPSIDRALEAVCLKAMALRPEDRYTSPRLLAEDIERWMADEPVSACREPWSRKLMRRLTRQRAGGHTRWVLRAWLRFWVWGAVVAVEATANAGGRLARRPRCRRGADPAVDGGHLQPQRSPTPQRGKE